MGYTYEQLKNWTVDSMFVSQMKVNSDGKYEAEFALDYNEKLELTRRISDTATTVFLSRLRTKSEKER